MAGLDEKIHPDAKLKLLLILLRSIGSIHEFDLIIIQLNIIMVSLCFNYFLIISNCG